MTANNPVPPKVFISYSWTNAAHEQWVLDLATDLIDSGANVILDKWDLREGQDSVAFMEQMVTDPEIQKVIMVCDERYKRKADGRDGGVGTETQIISKSVYENTTQEKFVAVVAEKDPDGKPYLPTYYSARIYIDLSDQDRFASEFERLQRWIFDKPLYVKPQVGRKPAFLDEPDAISLGTAAAQRRCVDALKNLKQTAPGALDEYFDLFANNLERFRIPSGQAEPWDEQVLKSIEEFLPHRNEAIELFQLIAHYGSNVENAERIHRFFERLFPYTQRPPSVMSYKEWDFDNFRFMVHELFLYALAIFLRAEKFDLANVLIQQPYYVAENPHDSASATTTYAILQEQVASLEHRNQRLGLNRTSLHADLLKERSSGTGLEFSHIMQADFVAFIRREIDSQEIQRYWNRWWPVTLVYIGHFSKPFEIFARATSRAYFERMKCILGIDKTSDLDALMQAYASRARELPRWHYSSVSPHTLMGVDNLCSVK